MTGNYYKSHLQWRETFVIIFSYTFFIYIIFTMMGIFLFYIFSYFSNIYFSKGSFSYVCVYFTFENIFGIRLHILVVFILNYMNAYIIKPFYVLMGEQPLNYGEDLIKMIIFLSMSNEISFKLWFLFRGLWFLILKLVFFFFLSLNCIVCLITKKQQVYFKNCTVVKLYENFYL